MKIHECFDRVLKEYQSEFTASDLAEVSGITKQTISNFRNGKLSPKIETFDKLLEGLYKLSPSAYARLHSLMASARLDIVQLAANSPSEIQGKILVAIANSGVFQSA